MGRRGAGRVSSSSSFPSPSLLAILHIPRAGAGQPAAAERDMSRAVKTFSISLHNEARNYPGTCPPARATVTPVATKSCAAVSNPGGQYAT